MIPLDLVTALPELLLACLAMALLMFGAFRGDKATPTILLLSVATLVVIIGLIALGPGGEGVAFGGLFVSDGYGDFMKVLVLIGAATAMVMSLRYFEQEGVVRFEYPILMLFATLGMMMMISANDLIALYLGLELQSLSLYVIAAIRRDSLRSTAAGLKYFVLGGFSTGFLLLGLTLLYEIHDIARFSSVQRFSSYCRLVKPEHRSAGKRTGSGGAKIGNAHLKWAFSEAAVLFLKDNTRGQAHLKKLERRHSKGKALSILAARLGRATYFMLKNSEDFDIERFYART